MTLSERGRPARNGCAGAVIFGARGGRTAAVLRTACGQAARAPRGLATILLVLIGLTTTACRQDMHDQPKYQAYGASKFFDDGRDMRPELPGTVARGHLDDDPLYDTGKVDGRPTTTLPMPVTMALLNRGQERYDIYCSPCHDRTGSGAGMIVQRGYRKPTSFHDARLREAPVGYFFDVTTNGFGVMPAYRAQIPTADRWAITAYIRALQLSQSASVADVPPAERARLDAAKVK